MAVGPTPPQRWQVLLLGALTTLIMVPVTLPVPVLRGLVQDRFAVSDLQTSAFMSINMVGACLAAPLAGALADRFGRRKPLICAALLLDAACFWLLTADVPFAAFLVVRFVEGCAHIFALSLLLSMASHAARDAGRGRTMGAVGAGICLGVAMGAPLGGQLGRHHGALLPIQVGALLLGATAVLVAVALRDLDARAARPRLADILRLVRRDRAVLVPLVYAFADRFTVGFFTTTFPLYLKRVHELTPDRIGLLLGLFLGPFCLLSYPAGRLSEKVSRSAMLAGGSAAYGALLCTLGAFEPTALPVVMLALGCLAAVMFVPSLVMTTELTDRGIAATAMGAFNAAGSLGFIVGPLTGGLVTELVAARAGWRAGYASAFAVAGASEILCAALTLPALRRLVAAKRTT